GSIYEGGLRVPAIIEWPGGIAKPRVTKYPAGAVDIFPTIAEITGLPAATMLQPQDGLSLAPLLAGEIGPRSKPLPFHSRGRAALIDNDYKILSFPKNPKGKKPARMELYNLANDTTESNNLINKQPEIARRMKSRLRTSVKSIEASVKGSDYPEGKVNSPQPPRIFWTEVEAYKPYFEQWRKRPEYQSRLK
ncbi:MAG: sulfatase/phosphatase domain-containing protein, partial [Verrucomicrobiales bacterium]